MSSAVETGGLGVLGFEVLMRAILPAKEQEDEGSEADGQWPMTKV